LNIVMGQTGFEALIKMLHEMVVDDAVQEAVATEAVGPSCRGWHAALTEFCCERAAQCRAPRGKLVHVQ
jgi:hypothetical protein